LVPQDGGRVWLEGQKKNKQKKNSRPGWGRNSKKEKRETPRGKDGGSSKKAVYV